MSRRIDGLRTASACCAFLVAITSVQAAEPGAPAGSPGTAAPARPRIGLVLAGGGAKGGAHVGVLKVLEEQHIQVDCIAGTSMGALIGAGYASGIPAKDLEKFLVSINWGKVVGGVGQRDLQPIEQKRAGVTYSNDFELGLENKQVIVPGGIVNTASIEDLLRTYVARARMQPDFDKLPIPFRAVATDMVSGDMVVMKDGDLATAMRASMSIPGAFAPVITDKYVLADGGMVRNIPVDVARDLCADVVIVVNLVEPSVPKEKLQTATQLIGRSNGVMIEANEKLSLASLTDRDVRIDVQMGDITTSDFERVPETIPLGEAAARKAIPQLQRLSVPTANYQAWRARVTEQQALEATLADVKYTGLERVNPEFLADRAQVKPGDTVDIATISAEAQRMSALQDFESVEYKLTGDPANPTLEWLPQEKRWGPNYLKFDLGVYGSAGGDLGFVIYGKHTRTWVNSLGAEWRNELQLGYENVFKTSLYQPLDASHRWFVEPKAVLSMTREDLFQDGERVATYNFGDVGGVLDFGLNLGNRAQARLGYAYTRRTVDIDTGSPFLPTGDRDDAGLTFVGTYDSRDTATQPTKGIAGMLEYVRSDESLGGDLDWERIEAGMLMAIPVRKDVVWAALAGGSNLGSDLPKDRMFTLGGPGSFPGYELGEVRSEDYWSASGSYLWKMTDIMSLRGQALYTGVRLQVGQTYDRLDLVEEGEVYGGSVFITGRTQAGPFTLGIGATSTDTYSVWLAVGRPIGHGTILERGIFR
jgi:NTE family protein